MIIFHTVEFHSPAVGGTAAVVRQIPDELAERGRALSLAGTTLAERPQSGLVPL